MSERTDADIAESALNVLAWNASVPRDHVKVMVENSKITLTGRVDWNYQKMAAEDVVYHLMGVRGVANLVTLKPRDSTTAADIKTAIENAFKRTAVQEADEISVTVNTGNVTLRGKAHNWKEKEALSEYAYAAPGVCSVQNDVAVTF